MVVFGPDPEGVVFATGGEEFEARVRVQPCDGV